MRLRGNRSAIPQAHILPPVHPERNLPLRLLESTGEKAERATKEAALRKSVLEGLARRPLDEIRALMGSRDGREQMKVFEDLKRSQMEAVKHFGEYPDISSMDSKALSKRGSNSQTQKKGQLNLQAAIRHAMHATGIKTQ